MACTKGRNIVDEPSRSTFSYTTYCDQHLLSQMQQPSRTAYSGASHSRSLRILRSSRLIYAIPIGDTASLIRDLAFSLYR